MQETHPADMTREHAEALGKVRQEFFSAENEELLRKKMDDRLEQLEKSGEVLSRRVQIEGSEIPGVVATLVMGVLGAHNKGQRRRLKNEAIKLIEGL